jgi:hypothetical protein
VCDASEARAENNEHSAKGVTLTNLAATISIACRGCEKSLAIKQIIRQSVNYRQIIRQSVNYRQIIRQSVKY